MIFWSAGACSPGDIWKTCVHPDKQAIAFGISRNFTCWAEEILEEYRAIMRVLPGAVLPKPYLLPIIAPETAGKAC